MHIDSHWLLTTLSLNWLKNDFTEEYSFDILDLKNLLEKGLFHLFGELFTAEVNSVRLGKFSKFQKFLLEKGMNLKIFLRTTG